MSDTDNRQTTTEAVVGKTPITDTSRDAEVPTATVDAGSDVMTLINVFNARPGAQQRLVDVLCEAGRTVMPTMPGFISASVHRSDDSTSVVNYVQWRSKEDFQAMLAHEAALPHLQEAASMAEYDPIICRPVEVSVAREDLR